MEFLNRVLLVTFFFTSHYFASTQNNQFDVINKLNTNENSDTLNLISSPLDEVIVTGQIYRSKLSESVNSFLLISNNDIQNNVSNNLADILSYQAIFDLDYDPFLGTSLSIQGMQGNNINILFDGVPIIGRKGTQIDLSQINLSNIDRIEVLKGPASVSYGTNSTGGVINLISKQNTNNQIGIETYLESIGVSKVGLNFTRKLTNHNIHFNAGRYYFTGVGDDDSRSQNWRSKDQHFGDFHWKTKIKNIEVFLKKSIFNELIIDLGDENFPPFSGTATDHHYLTYRDNNYLKMSQSNHEKYAWNSIFSWSKTRFINKQYNVDLSLNEMLQTDDVQYNTEDVFQSLYNRHELNYLKGDELKLQSGLELSYDYIEGSRIEEGAAEIRVFSFFSQAIFKITDSSQSKIGLRIPYNSIYKTPLIPSINFKIDLNEKTQIRLSYAKGFRAPSIKELFMEFVDVNHNIVGNSSLDIETSHSLQSSLNYIVKQDSDKYISLNIETFFNDLKNKIALAQIEDTDAYTYYNINDSKYYGLNSSFISKFTIDSNVLSTIDIMWNIFTIENESFDYKTPKQNFSIAYTYEYLKCNCGLNINWKIKSDYEFQRIGEDNNFNTYRQDGYQLFNFNIFKQLPLINSSIYVGVKNLFNVTDVNYAMQEDNHSSLSNTVSWGRTYFLKLNWQPF